MALQVLDDPEQCYAVVLSAVDGPALPPADADTPSVAAAAMSGNSTTNAAHNSSGGGGTAGAGVAGARDQQQPPTLQRSSQQRGQQPARQLEAEYAQEAAAGAARREGGGGAAGGAPAEGVTLWQYVSDGGASTTAVDSRAPGPLPGASSTLHSWCACIRLGSAAWKNQ